MTVISADVVVLGGGAAGLMCAMTAGARGRRVVVLEHNAQIGRKILISGGGRANFTNLHTAPENFISDNPHFVKSALARYGPEDFLKLVRKHRIAYHEKKLGQLFCDGSAREIVNMLEAECAAVGVRIETSCAVKAIEGGSGFVVRDESRSFSGESLVIATGGLSIPKLGATPLGYEVARQFGLRVSPCRPGLVPLTFNPHDRAIFGELAGVSLEVSARTGGWAFREKALFTHSGLSGPAILQASSYWKPGNEIDIDLLPGADSARLLSEHRAAGDRSAVRTLVGTLLPRRLASLWFDLHPCSKPVNALSDREIRVISEGLHRWRLTPAGTQGYEKAEVTAGGVDTGELSSKTFEAKRVPGLYFAGEVLDVTGHLGGFNFQWAWASGCAVGLAA
jgi:predicted Rossmann fold flavoprotein